MICLFYPQLQIIIFSSLCQRRSVVTVDVVRDRADNCVAVARKELLRTLNGAGTSVHVFHDEELEQKSKDLARLLKITGCVNFEFILDKDGNYHFLECNPRFSGRRGLLPVYGGIQLCGKSSAGFQGEEIEPFTPQLLYSTP